MTPESYLESHFQILHLSRKEILQLMSTEEMAELQLSDGTAPAAVPYYKNMVYYIGRLNIGLLNITFLFEADCGL